MPLFIPKLSKGSIEVKRTQAKKTAKVTFLNKDNIAGVSKVD